MVGSVPFSYLINRNDWFGLFKLKMKEKNQTKFINPFQMGRIFSDAHMFSSTGIFLTRTLLSDGNREPYVMFFFFIFIALHLINVKKLKNLNIELLPQFLLFVFSSDDFCSQWFWSCECYRRKKILGCLCDCTSKWVGSDNIYYI